VADRKRQFVDVTIGVRTPARSIRHGGQELPYGTVTVTAVKRRAGDSAEPGGDAIIIR